MKDFWLITPASPTVRAQVQAWLQRYADYYGMAEPQRSTLLRTGRLAATRKLTESHIERLLTPVSVSHGTATIAFVVDLVRRSASKPLPLVYRAMLAATPANPAARAFRIVCATTPRERHGPFSLRQEVVRLMHQDTSSTRAADTDAAGEALAGALHEHALLVRYVAKTMSPPLVLDERLWSLGMRTLKEALSVEDGGGQSFIVRAGKMLRTAFAKDHDASAVAGNGTHGSQEHRRAS